MTSKERAGLKAQAMKLDSIFQIGKSSLTPEQVEAIRAALESRELIKIHVLKNCSERPEELAAVIAERTGSQVVQVIGKKIVLYKKNTRKQERKQQADNRKKRAGGPEKATAVKATPSKAGKKAVKADRKPKKATPEKSTPNKAEKKSIKAERKPEKGKRMPERAGARAGGRKSPAKRHG